MDNAATMSMLPKTVQEMEPFFYQAFANPSGSYSQARLAAGKINQSRKEIAEILNADENEIYFTSGGSESNNLAINGFVKANSLKGKHLIVSSIEHPSVLKVCENLKQEGYEISYVKADKEGMISPDEVSRMIRRDTILISVMHANNEIGTIEPVMEIGQIAEKNQIAFHSDCVQVIGHRKLDVKKWNVDMISASAHKFRGPKGIGFLYIKKGVRIKPEIFGGEQERGLRSGTENVAGIVGMKAALVEMNHHIVESEEYILNLQNDLVEMLFKKIPNIQINGSMEKRLPGNVHFSIPGISGEKLLMYLDMHGICASGGSACLNPGRKPSHVLKAIGLQEDCIEGSVRFSLSDQNMWDEIKYTVSVIEENWGKCIKK
ncbi:MAG: cysteine desulfurase family protein [Candidatus Pacebacteria bacterium]|nr:cysteine desulfurase family protein [Candidatus Paceibacterota bacterium]